MVKLDFTITIGDILVALGICGSVLGGAWAVVRKFNQFIFVFREYPPHRHTIHTEGIVYPKGMTPEPVREAGGGAST